MISPGRLWRCVAMMGILWAFGGCGSRAQTNNGDLIDSVWATYKKAITLDSALANGLTASNKHLLQEALKTFQELKIVGAKLAFLKPEYTIDVNAGELKYILDDPLDIEPVNGKSFKIYYCGYVGGGLWCIRAVGNGTQYFVIYMRGRNGKLLKITHGYRESDTNIQP